MSIYSVFSDIGWFIASQAMLDLEYTPSYTRPKRWYRERKRQNCVIEDYKLLLLTDHVDVPVDNNYWYHKYVTLNSWEDIAENTINVEHWKSDNFISWDANVNSFASKLHNLYSAESNLNQFKTNTFSRYCSELNKLPNYVVYFKEFKKKYNTDIF